MLGNNGVNNRSPLRKQRRPEDGVAAAGRLVARRRPEVPQDVRRVGPHGRRRDRVLGVRVHVPLYERHEAGVGPRPRHHGSERLEGVVDWYLRESAMKKMRRSWMATI